SSRLESGARYVFPLAGHRQADHRRASRGRHRAPPRDLSSVEPDGRARSAPRAALSRAAVRHPQAGSSRIANVARSATGALQRCLDRRLRCRVPRAGCRVAERDIGRHAARGTRHLLEVHAALATVALLFSLNYIISKLGLHAFTPMTFAYLRVLGSALILNLLFRQRDLPPLSRSDHWRVIAYSVLGVVINQFLFLSGLALTSAHVSAILMTLIPVFTLAAAIVAGREQTSLLKISGIA